MALERPARVAYVCLGCYLVAERLLRRGHEARDMKEDEEDRGTTRGVGRAFGLSLLILSVAPLLNRGGRGRGVGTRVAWGGVVLMGGGLALRVWAARVLGALYTRTLRTSTAQRLVAEGPYRLVRHPRLSWWATVVARRRSLHAELDRGDDKHDSHDPRLPAPHSRGRGHARRDLWRRLRALSRPDMAAYPYVY